MSSPRTMCGLGMRLPQPIQGDACPEWVLASLVGTGPVNRRPRLSLARSGSISAPRTSPSRYRAGRAAGRSCTRSTIPQVVAAGQVAGAGRCCRRSCTCPARTTSPRVDRPAVEEGPAGRRRRVRPQPRGEGARPAGGRRPSRGCATPASIAPRRSCRGPGRRTCRGCRRSRCRRATSSTSSRRGTPAPNRKPADHLEEQDGRADGAGVVRRRGPQPDRGGGEAGRA